MQHLDFREWSIAYQRMGSGPSVLFLHNGGSSHRIWLPIMESLADSYDVAAIDLLGYGESSKPGHSYDMDTYVDMVRTVLDTLGMERVILVGNCMGSAISIHTAEALSDRVRGLVLVNPLTERTFSKGWLAGVLKLRQAAPSVVGGLYRTLGKIRLPKWSASSALSFQLGQRGRKQGLHHDEVLQGHHASQGQLDSMLSVLADIEAYADIDALSEERIANLPPLATYWGSSNRILSAKEGEALNEQLSPVMSGASADCGHLVMMEAPDEVAQFIHSFSEQLPEAEAHV